VGCTAALSKRFQSLPLNQSQVAAMTKLCPRIYTVGYRQTCRQQYFSSPTWSLTLTLKRDPNPNPLIVILKLMTHSPDFGAESRHLSWPAVPFPVHYFDSSPVDEMIVPGDMVCDYRSVHISDRSFFLLLYGLCCLLFLCPMFFQSYQDSCLFLQCKHSRALAYTTLAKQFCLCNM